MAGFRLRDVAGLPDPQLIDRFRLDLGLIPTTAVNRGVNTVNNEALAIRCQQVAIPGVEIEPVEVPLHGMRVFYRGRGIFQNSMSATFVETRDNLPVNALLRGWREMIVGTDSGNGLSKAEYSVSATLSTIDERGNVSASFELYGVWIQRVDEIQLDGQSSQAMMVNAMFQYDEIRSPLLYQIDGTG